MKRAILENLERRKREQICPCDDCDATGRIGEKVCSSCLGQSVLLTKLERDYLLEIAGFAPGECDDDSVLNEQYFIMTLKDKVDEIISTRLRKEYPEANVEVDYNKPY